MARPKDGRATHQTFPSRILLLSLPWLASRYDLLNPKG
jgi:hypothetical protein